MSAAREITRSASEGAPDVVHHALAEIERGEIGRGAGSAEAVS